MHSILADHSFNLDVNALVGKVHTISAKRKTISAESIQFRKCLIGFCKRFPSSRLPSLGRLLSRLPCDSPWVFPDRPNFLKQTCDPVSNQRRFPNSGGQWQVGVGSGQRCLCGVWLITLTACRGRDGGVSAAHRGERRAIIDGRRWLRRSGSATSNQVRDGMVNLRPLLAHWRGRLQATRRRSAPSVGRQEQGSAGDVSGWQSPVDAETSGPHLAAVRVPAARAAMSLYARRLASPHSPGRHLDCHTVGDRRSGCRSIPALKHGLAWVRDEVRYLTCIWQDIWQVLCYQSFFCALRVLTGFDVNELPSVLPNVVQYWRCTYRVNTHKFYSTNAQNLLSKLYEHCLIRFALCRIWNVCRNVALRRNSTFIRRNRCALSPKLNALYSITSWLILITCDTFEYGCTMPYCPKLTALFPNYVHCFQNWPEKGVCRWRDVDQRPVFRHFHYK